VDALGRLESWLQSLVEEPARWLTGQRLQPVEIARRLAVAMDDGILVTGERPLAPNRFVASLAERDYAPLAAIKASLQGEFERFLEDEATGRGYRLSGPPRVELRLDTSQPAGRVTVVATHDAPNVDAFTATRVMQVVAKPRGSRSIVLRADGKAWFLKPGDRLTVGRAPESDILLDDASVSRSHALVSWHTVRGKAPAVEVEDLGSTNHTRVGGREVVSAVVRLGETVHFGDVEVHVSDGSASPPHEAKDGASP
jgi:hypothetical protein